MLMKYVRTGCRTGAEHIHLGNRVDLYTAVGYRWPWSRPSVEIAMCKFKTGKVD